MDKTQKRWKTCTLGVDSRGPLFGRLLRISFSFAMPFSVPRSTSTMDHGSSAVGGIEMSVCSDVVATAAAAAGP